MTTPAQPRAAWRTSSWSGETNCVEVAPLESSIAIRDSKLPDAGHLTFAPKAWGVFVTEAKAGRYDQGAT
ncbi:DUF397 domain-containing protein [Actinomadura sp. 9N215]|uniref:DUF397 domain-containing protein n=1 Tax=Actinomadura sp. 9N215 TaxID=3375150 RepID=UPI0037A4B960